MPPQTTAATTCLRIPNLCITARRRVKTASVSHPEPMDEALQLPPHACRQAVVRFHEEFMPGAVR